MEPSDSVYFSLSKHTQGRIDEAFGNIITSISLSNPDTADSEGGFFVNEAPEIPREAQIPFDLVPNALRLLNLPPDDEQVLSVFRNAATGWKSSSLEYPNPQNNHNARLGVSLEDWRSVCAILLEDEESDQQGDRDPGEEAGSDIYQQSENAESNESSTSNSDDDFQPDRISKPAKRAPRISSSTSKTTLSKPSDLQKQASLETFSLFFPGIPPSDLPQQKIMIRDIQRVANLLKENLKADEIIDMLEMFSSSSDKALSFEDFSRMLVSANLV